MKLSEVKMLSNGDEVLWTDPGDNTISRTIVIREIEILCKKNPKKILTTNAESVQKTWLYYDAGDRVYQ